MVNPFVSQWIVKQYISKENWIHVLEEELQYIYFEFFQVGQKAYLIPINTEPKDHGIYAVQYEFEIDLGFKIVSAVGDGNSLLFYTMIKSEDPNEALEAYMVTAVIDVNSRTVYESPDHPRCDIKFPMFKF